MGHISGNISYYMQIHIQYIFSGETGQIATEENSYMSLVSYGMGEGYEYEYESRQLEIKSKRERDREHDI